MPLASILLCLLIGLPSTTENLVLVNGTIVDGTGNLRIVGNVRIQAGVIMTMGAFKPTPDETVLDVKGMIVAPGFINLHARSTAESQVRHGVTLAVLGQEGDGPIAVEDFMQPFDREPPAMNIATFVGYGTSRVHQIGDKKQPAAPGEFPKIGEAVEFGMREGAFGLSVGLQKEPGRYASTEELVAMAKFAGRYGGFYITDLRDKSDKVVDAVKEAIEISRLSKVPVHISGITGRGAEILALIDRAHTQMIDVTADVSLAEQDVIRDFLKNRWVMTAGDDTFAFVLDQLVRDKTLTMEAAVRKMTGMPASRLSLKERGILKKGNAADLVVFDPSSVAQGMKYVFVNGTMVVKQGELTGEKPGRALR